MTPVGTALEGFLTYWQEQACLVRSRGNGTLGTWHEACWARLQSLKNIHIQIDAVLHFFSQLAECAWTYTR